MSTKQEIIENLVIPLVSIFGDMKEGHIEWIVKNCEGYTPEQLRKAADEIIETCESFPYPATIMSKLKSKKFNTWKN
jgi:hypothetical protein